MSGGSNGDGAVASGGAAHQPDMAAVVPVALRRVPVSNMEMPAASGIGPVCRFGPIIGMPHDGARGSPRSGGDGRSVCAEDGPQGNRARGPVWFPVDRRTASGPLPETRESHSAREGRDQDPSYPNGAALGPCRRWEAITDAPVPVPSVRWGSFPGRAPHGDRSAPVPSPRRPDRDCRSGAFGGRPSLARSTASTRGVPHSGRRGSGRSRQARPSPLLRDRSALFYLEVEPTWGRCAHSSRPS